MEISKMCKSEKCWASRYEILGLVFLIIATLLTIIAWSSLGIVAMFVVGLVLIGHKHFCYLGCHSSCHSSNCHASGCHSEEESCEKECHSKHEKVVKEPAQKK